MPYLSVDHNLTVKSTHCATSRSSRPIPVIPVIPVIRDVRMIRSGSDLFSLSRSRGQSCKGALRVVGCFRAGRWLQGQYI